MKKQTRVLHDNPALNYDGEEEIDIRHSGEQCVLIEIKAYKPGDLRLEKSSFSSVGWSEYGESHAENPSITWMRFDEYPGWNVFSAMCHRDGISVVLTP